MKLILLGIYTMIIAGIWGFFVVAKLHAYKFKNFSNYIVPFTNTLFIILGILTIVGYAILFSYNESNNSSTNYSNSSNSSSNINY